MSQGHHREALSFYRRSAQASLPENDQRSASRAYQYLAELYQQQGQADSSIFYARKALALAYPLPFVVGIMRNSTLLTQAFEQRHPARQRPALHARDAHGPGQPL